MAADADKLIEALKRVDWPRVLHRGALLVRVLRGDANVITDHQREQARGETARRTINTMARSVIGCCKASDPSCDCPLCREERDAR